GSMPSRVMSGGRFPHGDASSVPHLTTYSGKSVLLDMLPAIQLVPHRQLAALDAIAEPRSDLVKLTAEEHRNTEGELLRHLQRAVSAASIDCLVIGELLRTIGEEDSGRELDGLFGLQAPRDLQH